METQQVKQFQAEAKEMVAKFYTIAHSSQNWKFEEKIGETYLHSQQDITTDLTIYKGEAVIHQNAEEIVEFVQDYTYRQQYSEFFDKGETLFEFDKNTKILHEIGKGVAIVAPRDYVVLATIQKLDDGSYVICFKSVEFRGMPESPKGVVRSNIHMVFWHFIPLSENQTKVIYAFQVDIMGWIPKFIMNKAIKSEVGCIEKLSEAMKQVKNQKRQPKLQ